MKENPVVSEPQAVTVYQGGALADLLNADIYTDAPECQETIAKLKAAATAETEREQPPRIGTPQLLDECVAILRTLNEETAKAGFPGGDRAQTLANVRALIEQRAELLAALREARERVVYDMPDSWDDDDNRASWEGMLARIDAAIARATAPAAAQRAEPQAAPVVVRVEVSGGVADLADGCVLPPGVRLEIYDHDNAEDDPKNYEPQVYDGSA